MFYILLLSIGLGDRSDITLTQLPQSCSPPASAGADLTAVDQISIAVRDRQRTADVVEPPLGLPDLSFVLEGRAGWSAGGPGELGLGVDPLRAAGDPVFYQLQVDFIDWSCQKKKIRFIGTCFVSLLHLLQLT